MRSLAERVGPQRWPAVRAALLAVVVAVHGFAALPMPRAVSADRAGSAAGKVEVQLWLDVLASLGLHPTAAELLSTVNAIGKAATGLRQAVLAPAKPLMRITQTGQSWALFAYPDRFPQRLEVHGRATGGDWELLYRALDPDHQVVGPQIRFRRVRGVYDTAASRASAGKVYERFVDHVAAEVFALRPDLDEVQLRMVQFHVALPGETAQPDTVRLRRTRQRQETP